MQNDSKFGIRVAVAFVGGLLFAIGLALAGMTLPNKVIGFLDIFGQWDPTLAFVMAGAVWVHFWSYRLIKNRPHPIFDDKWHYPTSKEITSPLILGSALFGVGWGIAGFCPGPALTTLGTGKLSAIIVVVFMTLGMATYNKISKAKKG